MAGLLCLLTLPAWGQQRPLRTDDADLLPVGKVRTELGVEFLQGQAYSLSGLEGDLTRLGTASIHVGMGEYAEFQISGVFQDFLTVTQRSASPPIPPDLSGNTTHDFGDMVLATKLKLAGEKGVRPSIGFKFAVQLPNAKHDSGLGTDQTEFFASLLFSKEFKRARLIGNAGFAILGSPVLLGRQTDPLTYGAGIILHVHRNINLVGEINGRQGPPDRLGNENQSQIRAGIQLYSAGLRWDVGAVAGLKEYDPDSGFVVGITYEFQAFHKRTQASPRQSIQP